VLVRRHFERLGTVELAETLGMAESGVKSRPLRAPHPIGSLMEGATWWTRPTGTRPGHCLLRPL
jgi:hypothetical protein